MSGAEEFERQVGNLVERGYPALAGLSEAGFRTKVAPLEEAAAGLNSAREEHGSARIPFVIALRRELADPEAAARRIERDGKSVLTMLESGEPERWQPIESVELPLGDAYLVADIDTGAETLDVRPNDAIEMIAAQGRSPLTLEEGIALVTHHPGALAKNACFYMLGSRCGDKRVVALWLGKNTPKLGWCWAGNPHTWLGSASCGSRIGA